MNILKASFSSSQSAQSSCATRSFALPRLTSGLLLVLSAFSFTACTTHIGSAPRLSMLHPMDQAEKVYVKPQSPLEQSLQVAQVTSPIALNEFTKDAIGAPYDDVQPENTVNLKDHSAQKDLWGRIRQGFSVPDLETDLVRQHEQSYAAHPEAVRRMTERSSRYLYHILAEIERRGMPAELALLPFIESAFNPQAMSGAKASGMWQFIPSTGKDYDLKQNLFRDDRRDVLASTRAALDYLQRLYGMFGDWHLALAAYNWGEGNVQRAIARNQRAGLPTDYASLNMPNETRNYVPKLQAVKNIVAHPEAFGLALAPIDNHPYFVSVPIKRDIDAALAAKFAGLSMSEFQALNPSLNKPMILANGTPQLLLPYDNAEEFVHNLEQHQGPLATWTAWVVPATMRPSEVAKRVGMDEATLRSINRIPPKMLVKAGSTLIIPRSEEHHGQNISEEIADNAVISLAPDTPPLRKLIITTARRDTLASLAQRYRVSPQQITQWNKLRSANRLNRGQQIVLYVPQTAHYKNGPSTEPDTTPKNTVQVASTNKSPASQRRVVLASADSSTRGKRRMVSSRTVAMTSKNATTLTKPSSLRSRANSRPIIASVAQAKIR